jgi:hypothetical protein
MSPAIAQLWTNTIGVPVPHSLQYSRVPSAVVTKSANGFVEGLVRFDPVAALAAAAVAAPLANNALPAVDINIVRRFMTISLFEFGSIVDASAPFVDYVRRKKTA